MPKATLKISEIVERLRVTPHTVGAWIQAGDLEAIDVSRSGKKASWRVTEEALAAFIAARTRGPIPAKPPRRRRKQAAAEQQFY